MCILCESFQPWCEDCAFAAPADHQPPGTAIAAPTVVFTYDQVANQLTDGYWNGIGSSARAFDVSSGNTLFVDITGLDADGQAMARQALGAWSAVAGITFAEVNSAQAPNTIWNETADADAGTATIYSMSVGDDFTGSLTSGPDRDAVAVNLSAGQTVTIELSGDATGGNPTADPYLWLLNGTGAVVAQNDDAVGSDSAVTYQAVSSGTYYIRAGSFADNHPGDYRVSVRDVSAVADIIFDDEQAGAYTTLSVSGGFIQSAFVNVNANWTGGVARTDSYYFQTYLHEIGHALGLGHAGNYNSSASYGSDALYLNDSWQTSVMSYFHQTENTWLNDSFAYAVTPMMADVLAIQTMYGTSANNAGNTTYGDGANSGTYLDNVLGLSNPVTFTIVDTAGIDTLDFSSYSAHQRLDLRQETYSDLAGLDGNIGIARGTVIENGLTGGGNDTLVGNDQGNGLSAGAGNDSVDGGAGNDAIRGGAGMDILTGGDGFDLVEGGTGDNVISGGNGSDLLIGGDVTLAMLTSIYPGWTPAPDAQSKLDKGDLVDVWADIVDDLAFA